MDDTAQPQAAETEPLSRQEAMDAAASAIKVHLGQEEPRPRDEKGRFASQETEETEEIEADEGEAQAEPEEAEYDEEAEGEEEAAEEAQPDEPQMPSSWSKDDAQLWEALPPEVQGKIAEREGQRDAAVNQKFQESANARKAAEAAFVQAQTVRSNYTQALEAAISLIQPQWPSPSMLDIDSDDYDPDAYHLQRAKAEHNQGQVQQLLAQRQQVAAQAQAESAQQEQLAATAINQVSLPSFEAAYPEIKDRAKAEPFLAGLIEFAMGAGAPPEFFHGPITAVEWHLIADAKKWRDSQAALKKVKSEPKPEPRKHQPALRPGVATSRSAVRTAQRNKAVSRHDREHSIDSGAAVIKSLMKGQNLK